MRIDSKILLGFGALLVAAVLGLTIWGLPFATRAAPSAVHLSVDSHGQITADGRPMSEAQLRRELQRLRLRPEVELHFTPSPDAPYKSVDQVVTAMKRSGTTKIGFVGNKMYVTDDPGGNAVTAAH